MHGQHYYNISDIPKDSCDFHRSISVGNLTIYEPNSQELDLQKVLNFETHDNLSLTAIGMFFKIEGGWLDCLFTYNRTLLGFINGL